MAWTGWVAAIGGILAVASQWAGNSEATLLWIGGAAAVVFGVWGAVSD